MRNNNHFYGRSLYIIISTILCITMDGPLHMINIYEYLDYRSFLHDYWQSVKKVKPYFSIRFIAKRVGLNPGYVIKVLHSQVHLGINNRHAILQCSWACLLFSGSES